MTDNTITTRSQALRKRRKAAGMVRIEMWVPANMASAAKSFVEALVYENTTQKDKILGETND
jgi:hypothetical protein